MIRPERVGGIEISSVESAAENPWKLFCRRKRWVGRGQALFGSSASFLSSSTTRFDFWSLDEGEHYKSARVAIRGEFIRVAQTLSTIAILIALHKA
jgi:hypothetical protein